MKRLHDEGMRWTEILTAHWIAGCDLSHTAIKNRINKEIAKGKVRQIGGARGPYRLTRRKRRR